MTYILLKYAHILGAILIGGGLIGVWVSDLRSRNWLCRGGAGYRSVL